MKGSFKKSQVRLAIDCLLLVCFSAQFVEYPKVAFWHEVVGAALALCVVTHVVLDFPIAKSLIGQTATRKSSLEAKASIVIDCALLVVLACAIATGLATTKFACFATAAKPRMAWVDAHLWSSFLMALLIGIHMGLHARIAVNAIGERRRSKPRRFRLFLIVCVTFPLVAWTIASLQNSELLMLPSALAKTFTPIQDSSSSALHMASGVMENMDNGNPSDFLSAIHAMVSCIAGNAAIMLAVSYATHRLASMLRARSK